MKELINKLASLTRSKIIVWKKVKKASPLLMEYQAIYRDMDMKINQIDSDEKNIQLCIKNGDISISLISRDVPLDELWNTIVKQTYQNNYIISQRKNIQTALTILND